jgi:hypothetical protein
MKIPIRILMTILTLTMSSCRVVNTENYVHIPTEAIRRSIDDYRYRQVTPNFERNEEYLAIPNFYRFWPGHSGAGSFYFIAKNDTPIEIAFASITDPITQENRKNTDSIISEPWVTLDGYEIHSIRIIDLVAEDVFLDSEILNVTIEWRFKNESSFRKSKFELIKKHGKDIAYAT